MDRTARMPKDRGGVMPIFTCQHCGRDTRNRSRVCVDCHWNDPDPEPDDGPIDDSRKEVTRDDEIAADAAHRLMEELGMD